MSRYFIHNVDDTIQIKSKLKNLHLFQQQNVQEKRNRLFQLIFVSLN